MPRATKYPSDRISCDSGFVHGAPLNTYFLYGFPIKCAERRQRPQYRARGDRRKWLPLGKEFLPLFLSVANETVVQDDTDDVRC